MPASDKVYICIYSLFEDRFLPVCLESIVNSGISNYCIDLYTYGKKHLQPPTVAPNNLRITALRRLKNFAEVTNISLKKAIREEADYFLLLNSDTILHPKCISTLIEALKVNSQIAIVGGYQTEYNGDWNQANSWTKTAVLASYRKHSYDRNEEKLTLLETSYVQGACMLFRPKLTHVIGDFDERFKLFYEETEFCRRARRKGLIVGMVKKAKIKHAGGGTWKNKLYLHLKRDVLYLSNQIIFESTELPHGYLNLARNIIKIARKQIRMINLKTDNIILPIWLYLLVVGRVIIKSKLLFDLHHNQKS